MLERVEHLLAYNGDQRKLLIFSGLLVVAALIPFTILAWYTRFVGEDAYISLRYVKNALDGHGLVYNPGERVAGYSTFLWVTMLWTVAKITGYHDVPRIAAVLGIASSVLAILVLWFAAVLSDTTRRYPVLTVIPPLLLATSPAFFFWSGSGMETTFQAFLISLTLLLLLMWQRTDRPSLLVLCSIACSLVALARSEGVILFAVVGSVLLIWPQGRSRTWILLRFAIPFVLLLGAWLLWMKWYYGDFLYNPIYVKQGGTPFHFGKGLSYIKEWLREDYVLLLLMFPTVAVLQDIIRSSNRFNLVLLAYFASFAVFVVYVGGDYMGWSRFFVPILPVVYLILWQGVAQISTGRNPRYLYSVAILTGFLLVLALRIGPARNLIGCVPECDPVTTERQLMGEWLGNEFPPDTLTLSGVAGALPYYSELPNIDASGLNDRHIARNGQRLNIIGHGRTDATYAFTRNPKIVVLENDLVSEDQLDGIIAREASTRNAINRDIASQSEFLNCYEAKTIELKTDGWWVFYVRKEGCKL